MGARRTRGWSYLFDLRLLDFLQGNSDPLRLQFGSLLLLVDTEGNGHSSHLHNDKNHTHGKKTQNPVENCRKKPFLIVFIHVVYYSAAGMRRCAHTTSLNSKQPSKPFKTQKPWAQWHTTTCAKPTALLPSLFGLPTCPLQQDAITSIPQVVHASTHGRWHHLCPLVQSKTNINSQSVAIAPSPPSFPLKYGAPFAVYGSILDSYGAAATSFDLAVQQRGNNSGRSLKGERLRMSLGSVLRLCVLSSDNYSSLGKIALESQWQHRNTSPDSSGNLNKKVFFPSVCRLRIPAVSTTS